jgi:hypothetical protein
VRRSGFVLLAQGAGLALGATLMLLGAFAGGVGEAAAEAPAPLPAETSAAAPASLRPTLSFVVPPEPARAFIDTRMPVATWRAISLPEQRLIEAWNASPEKARGLASLEDWADAKAPAMAVDAALLKAKLRRDA